VKQTGNVPWNQEMRELRTTIADGSVRNPGSHGPAAGLEELFPQPRYPTPERVRRNGLAQTLEVCEAGSNSSNRTRRGGEVCAGPLIPDFSHLPMGKTQIGNSRSGHATHIFRQNKATKLLKTKMRVP